MVRTDVDSCAPHRNPSHIGEIPVCDGYGWQDNGRECKIRPRGASPHQSYGSRFSIRPHVKPSIPGTGTLPRRSRRWQQLLCVDHASHPGAAHGLLLDILHERAGLLCERHNVDCGKYQCRRRHASVAEEEEASWDRSSCGGGDGREAGSGAAVDDHKA